MHRIRYVLHVLVIFGLLYKPDCFVCIERAYDSPYESFFNESPGYCEVNFGSPECGCECAE